ncbi:cytochrome P450 [Kribbella antibiotica]|uniref:Cytochrome P450 n=1 Tax=Kribbella antibiotica TaxID=190195 RepID=A0A4R4YSV7_9ACTN|nr:cytochrome P450 [Kribbella antibiotica]TDD48313.1 cytochrome P450 [Kribbella antibiotica]
MVATYLKRWVGNRILSRTTRKGGLDLLKMRMFPTQVTLPLRRQGLDPLPALGEVREVDPVNRLAHVFGITVWMVTGHAESKAVLADTTNFSNDIRPLVGSDPNKPSEGIGGLGFTDPPDHTRLRKLLTPEFTKRRLARLEPMIEKIVNDQLDLMEAKGPVADIVADFAFNVPFLLIADLLGVEEQDRDRFRALGPARFDLSAGGIGVFGSASESRDFLFEIVRKQRENPGDGLIGSIIRAQGDDLDDVELGGLADGVFLGGYETSASMLALGALVLLRNPEHFERIRTEPGAVDVIVEELLRYLTVVQVAFPRFARHDQELFGKQVKKGDLVAVSLSGADRDKNVFGDDAEDFYPRRASSAAHLAFGHGMHRCVGAELARMELRAAFLALAHRFPDLALAVPEEQLRFRELSIVYGLDSLPVQLHATKTQQAAG